MSTRSIRSVSNDDGTLIVDSIDAAGNAGRKELVWCATHLQPAWLYSDGSSVCMWEYITGQFQHGDGVFETHDLRWVAVAYIEGETE